MVQFPNIHFGDTEFSVVYFDKVGHYLELNFIELTVAHFMKF